MSTEPTPEHWPTGNPDVRVTDIEVVARAWHVLRRTTFEYRHADGRVSTEQRETYDRGNGATILLHDVERRTVLLSRQFRYPVYVNHHPDGMLVETAAGLLDGEDPATAIRREAAEELGVEVGDVEHVFDVYMSPGLGHGADPLLRGAVHAVHPGGRGRRARRGRRGHRGARAALRPGARDDRVR